MIAFSHLILAIARFHDCEDVRKHRRLDQSSSIDSARAERTK